MNVEQVREQLASCRTRSEMVDWVDRSKDLRISEGLSRRGWRDAVKEVGEHLRRNRRGEATALVLAHAFVDGNTLVGELRSAGVLRASRYQFRAAGPQELVLTLLSLKQALKFSAVSVEYLHSLMALYELAAEARKLRDALVRRLKARSRRALKSFLVMANQVFATPWENNPHLTPIADDDPEAEVIACEYPLIHESNSAPFHFIHGFAVRVT